MVPMSYWRCLWSLVQVKEVTFEEKSLPDQVLISHRQGTMMGSVTLLCAKHHSAFYFLDHEMGLSRSGNEITGMCPNSSLSCCNWFCPAAQQLKTLYIIISISTRVRYVMISCHPICSYIHMFNISILYFWHPASLVCVVSPPWSAQRVFICHLNPLKLSGYFIYHQI